MTTSDKRVNMRVSEENLELIKEAAATNGQDMTSFVLGAALDQARRVVLEARVTRLTADEAMRLDAALDAEPEAIPALTNLLKATRAQQYTARDSARA